RAVRLLPIAPHRVPILADQEEDAPFGAWILAGFGYDGQATFQSRSALVGILIAFSIVPAGASMVVALIMQLYHPERDIVRILRPKEEGRA
ncbi:MAG: hypothetical protein AAFZ18_40095, partial [Myxococcota bacterium]